MTRNNAANAHETATAAGEMTAQMETTRKHLDELVAVVGLRQRWPALISSEITRRA
ncbi:MAG: hypothetical protein ABSF98_29650 [Bryobacteraceae bacterium]